MRAGATQSPLPRPTISEVQGPSHSGVTNVANNTTIVWPDFIGACNGHMYMLVVREAGRETGAGMEEETRSESGGC